MRQGELRGLRWAHIDREKGFIRLPESLTNEGRPKRIPMNHHIRKALADIPRTLHHDFVFTYRGNPITERNGVKNSFRAACGKAGIPYGRKTPDGITFHDIRRTAKINI